MFPIFRYHLPTLLVVAEDGTVGRLPYRAKAYFNVLIYLEAKARNVEVYFSWLAFRIDTKS